MHYLDSTDAKGVYSDWKTIFHFLTSVFEMRNRMTKTYMDPRCFYTLQRYLKRF